MMRHDGGASAVWGSPAVRRRRRRGVALRLLRWYGGTVVWVPWLLLRRVVVTARNCYLCVGRVRCTGMTMDVVARYADSYGERKKKNKNPQRDVRVLGGGEREEKKNNRKSRKRQ